MNHFYGWARALDVVVPTDGVTQGPAVPGQYPGTFVTVYLSGTSTPAPIYASQSVYDVKNNPFLTDVNGGFQFYGPQSAYDLIFSLTPTPTAVVPDLRMPSYARATLPTPSVAGRLARVSDTVRGLWFDTGVAWRALGPAIVVEDFHAGGADHTAAFQAAFDAAKAAGGVPVLAFGPAYRISSTLTYHTSGNVPGLRLFGAGMVATVFDNRVANGPMLDLDGSLSASAYARGMHLSGFSITTTTAPAGSRGIDLHGQCQGRLEGLWIQGLSGDAIRILSNNNDSDASAYLTFDTIVALLNGGWGLNMPDPTIALGASGGFFFHQCVVDRNTLGGMRLIGLAMGISRCFLGSAGAVGATPIGLLIPALAAQTVGQITVEDSEFQNCADYLIDIQAVVGMSIRNCKLLFDGTPAVGIRVGDGNGTTQATNVTITRPQVRKDSGTITVVAFGSNAANGGLEDMTANTSVGLTPYTNAGVGTRVIESGVPIAPRVGAVSTDVAGGGAYTPDLAQGQYHRVIVTSAGTLTINAPIVTNGVLATSQSMDLCIGNASGGAITVTLNAAFSYEPIVNPTNGLVTTTRFVKEPGSNQWQQVGGWSAPH